MDIVKITGTNFVRDLNSMGLSNLNSSEKEEYYAKLRLLKNQKVELNSMQAQIDSIKNDVSTIKELLLQLISKES
jgi:hypothetical protein